MSLLSAQPFSFYASRTHYIDHMYPIYMEITEQLRGCFYVPESLVEYARSKGLDASGIQTPGLNGRLRDVPGGGGPLVTCAYDDLKLALSNKPRRVMIFMQHGVGLSFNHNGYAGGAGEQRTVSLFLHPNEHTANLIQARYPNKRGVVIGTPKLDQFFPLKKRKPNEKPIVCISFHWDGGKVEPEAGNALSHYQGVLDGLANCPDFELVGHAHPRIQKELSTLYERLGIRIVRDFEEVLLTADLYINDCSSTLYEACAVGMPVIILNAPGFRRDVLTGIRFWEYTDVGPQVNQPEELLPAIRSQLATKGKKYKAAQARATEELYPFRGISTQRAARTLEEYVIDHSPQVTRLESIQERSIGIMYMGFGEKAAKEIHNSAASLWRIGLDIPICVVGDTPVRNTQFIPWQGASPFDSNERHNFQFRAGRIKPGLYDLSPFQRTLYIDADTEFISDMTQGFRYLNDFDLAVAEEMLRIGQLYNQERAGWEINIKERDATIQYLGGNRNLYFLNSGVMFFRKSPAVKELFQAWGKQWLVWKQWDEQLALMRALRDVKVSLKVLDTNWNHPHYRRDGIIFHNYGRGNARMNVTKEPA